MRTEIYKDIEGYEGFYAISNYGNVYSYKSKRIIKPHNNGRYLQACLCVNQKTKYIGIHRLVAKAFIPNPNGYKEVNHKDEDRENNYVDNLEWCSKTYNLYYGTRIKRLSELNYERCRVPVCQYDKEGNFLNRFESISSAEHLYGYSHSNIIKCINGEIKTAYGYVWKYANSV